MPYGRSDLSVETIDKAEEIFHSNCALYKELKMLITMQIKGSILGLKTTRRWGNLIPNSGFLYHSAHRMLLHLLNLINKSC